ncbi:PAS domain S-box protein [Coraliomargarita sp. W4R72]
MTSTSTIESSENRWRLALECAGVGVWDWNAESGETYYSPRWKGIIGYGEDELESNLQEWKIRVHPQDMEEAYEKMFKHIVGATDNYSNEHRLRHKDGSYRWILTHGQVVERDANGHARRIVGTHTDITSKKALEQAKRDVDEQLWSAFEHAANGMALVSAQGKFLRVNDSFSRITGYSNAKLLALTFQEITHPDDLDLDVSYLEKMIQGELKFYELDKRYMHAEGYYIWIHLSVSIVPDDDGSPKYFIAQVKDITEQKSYEVELQEARARAEAADRAKSSFLAMMSHEIRTPMNAIIGYADLLSESKLQGEEREYINTITSHGELLLNLINDILDFSKIEAGELTVETRPFDLLNMLLDTVDLMRPQASDKSIQLIESYPDDLPKLILGDDYRVRQILINLMGNALKFTEAGTIRLEIYVDRNSDRIDQLVFAVSDTGIGMSKLQVSQLFRPFHQADNTMTRRFGGTGLGLAICRRLVEAMGGEIHVTSEPSKGSTFTFHLPLNEVKCDDHVQSIVTTDLPILHGRRVILLDQEGSLRQLLSHQLRRVGLLVSEHTTIESLLAAHQQQAADLIVYDLNDNENVAPLDPLRDPCGQLTVPVLLLTQSNYTQAPKDRLLKTLPKPINHSHLLDSLMEIFDNYQASEVSSESSKFAQRHPGKILIVEDNLANRKVLLTQLRNMGYDPDTAEDGLACLEALRHKRYDLVLMDLQMPKLNGLDATRRIREAEAQLMENPLLKVEPLKIVAVTADAIKGDRERALAAKMDDYIAKPVRAHSLRDILRRILA